MRTILSKINSALFQRGVAVSRVNYYTPFVRERDLRAPLNAERNIPGLRLDAATQRQFLENLTYADELLSIAKTPTERLRYSYSSKMFGPGDAEIFYGAIRHLRPKNLIEIGAGNSTLMAQEAIAKNRAEGFPCRHICIEPFENPWLEELGIEVVRERVERLPLSTFDILGPHDILFVDSSHTVRTQGDVLYEILELYGSLVSGVYVHVHDIFTPIDYSYNWVINKRKLWHEQYMLEAFLSFNTDFEIVCALNWLWMSHPKMLREACPVLVTQDPPNTLPGSFWFRRV